MFFFKFQDTIGIPVIGLQLHLPFCLELLNFQLKKWSILLQLLQTMSILNSKSMATMFCPSLMVTKVKFWKMTTIWWWCLWEVVMLEWLLKCCYETRCISRVYSIGRMKAKLGRVQWCKPVMVVKFWPVLVVAPKAVPQMVIWTDKPMETAMAEPWLAPALRVPVQLEKTVWIGVKRSKLQVLKRQTPKGIAIPLKTGITFAHRKWLAAMSVHHWTHHLHLDESLNPFNQTSLNKQLLSSQEKAMERLAIRRSSNRLLVK